MIYVFVRRLFVSLWLSAGIALALLLCSALAGQCAADSGTPGPQVRDFTEMSLEELMNVTVVTAGKRPETIANTAAAVFVITREDIERYGYQTLAQSLRRISGFYTEYGGSYDFVGVRGYLPASDLNRRVLVLVDGHKVNDYLYGQAPVNDDLPLDMQDIERIEVVKGPASALWGSEALLCVINCITKKASDIDGVEIRQDLGWKEGQRLAYGRVFSGGLEVSGSLSRMESDGQKQVYFPEYNIPIRNNGVAEGIDGERAGRGYLNMSYKGLKLVYSHVARVKEKPTPSFWTTFNLPGNNVKDERSFSELSYENPTPYAGDGKLFCRVYQDNYDAVVNWPWKDWVDGDGNLLDPLPDPVEVLVTRSVDSARALGAEARYSRNISSSVSAILGVEYVRTYSIGKAIFNVAPYDAYNDFLGDSTLLSYYMQTDWNVNDSLRVVAGTRLDDRSASGVRTNYGTTGNIILDKEWSGKNMSPRAGLIYKASPKSTLKLLYGQAFRSPSMQDLRTSDPVDLRPEKIKTTELVWEQQVGDNARLVTSLFASKFSDVILYVPAGLDSYSKQGTITTSGIETQYERRLHNGGAGYLGISVTNGKGDTSAPLPSSPKVVTTCGLSIPVFGNRANLASDVQSVGDRVSWKGDPSGSKLIANLTLTSSSLIKHADISLGVANLFNTRVFDPAQEDQVDDFGDYLDRIPQLGRTLQFQITYHM